MDLRGRLCQISSMTCKLKRLGPADVAEMARLNALFYAAFEDDADYRDAPPGAAYVSETLGDLNVIALVAYDGPSMAGGLVAYRLPKLEQARSEIYIYDLAVAAPFRRKGIATTLINEVRHIAHDTDAWVVYIQADQDDPPADTLYSGLGAREEVLHFDLTPLPRD